MSQLDPNMDLDSAVPKESKYLQKDDVGEAGQDLTIAQLTRENVSPQGEELKTVIHWTDNRYKPLILNQTNKNRLKALTKGSKIADIIGVTVNVYNDPMVEFGGNITGGLRIRQATRTAEAELQQQHTAQQAIDDAGPDDSIPF